MSREPNPTPLAPDHPGDNFERPDFNFRKHDDAFCAAMERAGYQAAPPKVTDPNDCRATPRPFAASRVLTASSSNL